MKRFTFLRWFTKSPTYRKEILTISIINNERMFFLSSIDTKPFLVVSKNERERKRERGKMRELVNKA